MTISRHWRGIAKPEKADDYIHHLRNNTFPELARTEGFIKASILRRPLAKARNFSSSQHGNP